MLLFDDLDRQRRAIAFAVIDRIKPVSNDAIRWSAGAMRLTVGEAIIPLYAVGDLGTRRDVSVLRLTDGVSEMAYAIAEAIEIVELPADIAPARGVGPIGRGVDRGRTGRVNWSSRAVFESAGDDRIDADMPVAGRRFGLEGDVPQARAGSVRLPVRHCARQWETAAVALAIEDTPLRDTRSPLVTLRRSKSADGADDAEDASIYRHHRPALIPALAARRSE
ncbi:hypothetical protein [Sphingomonas faeni]|uniref:hypothetical protein n=1 Tax=Sphingomonas faeni TaxID=185950 RepID=UPI0027D8F7E6|nr:hypothetical protein [Sphingomonas faeni]